MTVVSPKEILQATQIPSIPATLNEILRAAGDSTTTSASLEKLILRDANASVRILKTVNSAFYGLPQRVSSIGQAVVLLGFSAVKSIVSGLVMLETFGSMPDSDQEYLTEVWRHSLLSSKIVGLLAAKEPKPRCEELVLAATVHNIGHLLLRRHFGNAYAELMIRHGWFPCVQLETQTFGIDHATLGAALLADWGFATSTQMIVLAHHSSSPPGARSTGPTDIDFLRAADGVAEGCLQSKKFFNLTREEAPPDVVGALEKLGSSWDDMRARGKVILQAAESISALLQE